MTDRVLSALSLARKAGKVLGAIRSFKAALVLIAEDASDGTRKKFTDKSTYYEVPYHIYGTKESLAHAIGMELRSVVSVNDEGLADIIMKRLEEADVYGEQ